MYPGMGSRQRGASVSPSDAIVDGLPCYAHHVKPRIKMDVSNLMFSVVTLRPERGELVNNDGSVDTLLKLSGTIPIFYKGTQYNIPMDVWVTKAYPNSPPLLYVTPTKDMAIKPGHQNVDTSGQVYMPYLNQWSPGVSNLAEVIAHCAKSFGFDPPVYAKPSNGGARQQPAQNATSRMPYPTSSPPSYNAANSYQRPPSYGRAVNDAKPPPCVWRWRVCANALSKRGERGRDE